MNKNPYSLMFGRKPTQMISRIPQIEYMIDSFNNEESPQQVFVITGVRGSGKTVMMNEVSRRLKKDSDWIVVELNPQKDMLNMAAASLSSQDQLAQLFKTAKINLSFFGFGLSVDSTPPITDIEIALKKMLEVIKKKKKKVLFTIDEADNSKEMRVFISAFQIYVMNELPVYLLMTGLYENISDLQNEKNLTFLYRAPKIELSPLNLRMISENYQKTLEFDIKTADQMANLTKGYSFAFQVLGYFAYENQGFNKSVRTKYKEYLGKYSYEKIWSELSAKDKKICYGIAKAESGKTAEIREILDLQQNEINQYRKRLINKGIVNGNKHGYLIFVLPLFDEYVTEEYENEMMIYS